MKNSTQPRTFVRAINTLFALALAAFVLANYWPIVKLFELARADLQYQGEWIGGQANRITAVTPGGVADRAGLKPGDVLEFDPNRDADWVLASYRTMPQGFSATLPVRHPDGTRSLVALAPERVEFLPTSSDRLAVLARLCSLTLLTLVGVAMVWARPGLMTWSLLLAFMSTAPVGMWVVHWLANEAGPGEGHLILPALFTMPLIVAILPFALCFPGYAFRDLNLWKRALTVMVGAVLLVLMYRVTFHHAVPFGPRAATVATVRLWFVAGIPTVLIAIAALGFTYQTSGERERAKLRWALLGMTATLAAQGALSLYYALRTDLQIALNGSQYTPSHWIVALGFGVIFPLSLGYAVLRQRVVDVQFAISRTVVYGVVSTIVLVFLAVLHWLLGRMIEHSGFAFGVEGLAAVGLGLVLHRASHGINTTVDRVLFRKHHAAEERLRQVTAALPFASTEQSIAEAIVIEPTRNLELASAALFYRESSEGPLRRVLAVGWDESHASSLDAESLLVRYLQAEHTALRLDGEQEWLPAGMPEGSAHPVLAIPIVTQHVLTAVVLYGAHVNATLPDPDEVTLLEALAKAAATSHQQVRIAMLVKENYALQQENALERARNAQLSSLVRSRLAGASEASSKGG
jgi:hypothetical protein